MAGHFTQGQLDLHERPAQQAHSETQAPFPDRTPSMQSAERQAEQRKQTDKLEQLQRQIEHLQRIEQLQELEKQKHMEQLQQIEQLQQLEQMQQLQQLQQLDQLAQLQQLEQLQLQVQQQFGGQVFSSLEIRDLAGHGYSPTELQQLQQMHTILPDFGEDTQTHLRIDPDVDAHVGVIARFDEKNGYGFIKCGETFKRFGRDVFLHKMHFNRVAVGDVVSFVQTVNEKGMPQARRVRKLAGDQAVAAEMELAGAGIIDQSIYTGSVARFDLAKGYGFIVCDATKKKYSRDVFLRKSVYVELELNVGDTVLFQVELNEKGFPQARNTQRVDRVADSWKTPLWPQAAETFPLPWQWPLAHGGDASASWQALKPPTELPSLCKGTFTGQVARFDPNTGFGFIQSVELGQDIFLHRSGCCDGVQVPVGEAVTFMVDLTDKGPQARQVQRIADGARSEMPNIEQAAAQNHEDLPLGPLALLKSTTSGRAAVSKNEEPTTTNVAFPSLGSAPQATTSVTRGHGKGCAPLGHAATSAFDGASRSRSRSPWSARVTDKVG